ncbi:hypothetical protein B0H67DRAFT_448658, partial [Lasiosphaeris hirsuta]
LLAATVSRAALVQRPLARSAPAAVRAASSVPRLARSSFWKSMVPKFLRAEDPAEFPFGKPPGKEKPKTKEWNPATFFIVIFLLIGSMSIQMISLKKDFEAFTRQSDVRIGLLREVIEKLQKGEKVDVEKVLGAGDPAMEQGWEDILKEIQEDQVVRNKQQKQAESSQKTGPEPTPAPKSAQ